MRSFANVDEAIEVYTDGSHASKRNLYAYGWVVANASGSMTTSRVVAYEGTKAPCSAAALMESAAIVDALWEFANRGRKVIVYADNQALAHFIAKYRAGELTFSELVEKDTVIRAADAWRLGKLLTTLDFEIRWVKGHRDSFHNLVCDQMLRMASLDGEGEAKATAFANTALEARSARIWCKQSEVQEGETVYFNAYKQVYLTNA